jgi:hypothetical protein
MKKSELLARIEALEKRVLQLEAARILPPAHPAPLHPYTIPGVWPATCGTTAARAAAGY